MLADDLWSLYGDIATRIGGLLAAPGAKERFRQFRAAYTPPQGGTRLNCDSAGGPMLGDRYVWLGVVHDRCFPSDPINPADAGDELNNSNLAIMPILDWLATPLWGGVIDQELAAKNVGYLEKFLAVVKQDLAGLAIAPAETGEGAVKGKGELAGKPPAVTPDESPTVAQAGDNDNRPRCAPMNRAEIARRLLNKPTGRTRDALELMRRHCLRQESGSNLWTIRVDTLDPLARERLLKEAR